MSSNSPDSSLLRTHRQKAGYEAGLIACATILTMVVQFLLTSHNAAYFADPLMYLSGARSLASGQGYGFACYIDHPPIGTYPPLQSLWLSFSYRFGPPFPQNLDWLLGQMLVLSGVCLFLGQLYLRRLGAPLWATVLFAAAWGTSAHWVMLISWFWSDIGFSALIFALLLWWVTKPSPERLQGWAFTGLILSAAYLWRTAALSLIGIAFLAAVWRMVRYREAAPLFAVALPVACAMAFWKWMTHDAIGYGLILKYLLQDLGGVKGYVLYLQAAASELLSGRTAWNMFCEAYGFIPEVLHERAPLLAPVAYFLSMGIFWLLGATAGWGLWNLRKSSWNQILFAGWLGYLAQMVAPACNPVQYPRYLFPVLIVPLGWFITGVSKLPDKIRRPAKMLILALLVGAVGLNLRYTPKTTRHWEKFMPASELKEVADFIRSSLPAEALIAMDYRLPAEQLSVATGREFLTDYFSPSAGMTPVQHHQQGNRTADYLLTSQIKAPADFGAYEPPTNFPVVLLTSGGAFKLVQVPKGVTPAPVKPLVNESLSGVSGLKKSDR